MFLDGDSIHFLEIGIIGLKDRSIYLLLNQCVIRNRDSDNSIGVTLECY